MRNLITLFSIFIFTHSYAQVTFDKTVEQQYQDAYNKLPAWLQQKAIEAYKDTSFHGGLVVLTEHKIDTLNKDEVANSYSYKNDEEKQYDLSFCGGQINSDTLTIGVGTQFFSQSIQHKIFKNLATTIFNEYRDNGTPFRTELTNDKTNDLTIPAETIRIVLSADKFTTDETIFGYAEITTKAFYEDADSFKNGYIKKRLHYKYFFKFKPTKNGI
ncbi:hypothetical protein [Ferruginibacter sp.]|uniref:hypothetical protein n=1 Tax=Ferruginibacter sp. TaxID=1940288 RepID=UPI002659ED4F|nr:hypothetical protein [Ferruginibacter sp.]